MNGLVIARRTRGVLGALAFVALVVVTWSIARYAILTGFARYDDEGMMLVALRSFIAHDFRYDVFAGYGPFYYEFWGRVFSVSGMSVNHDNGRIATLVIWLASSLFIGLSTWRMTRSIVLGLATQLGVFQALFSLVNEPMHPGGIIVLLLSTLLLVACFIRDQNSPIAMALLGAAVMALILIKINVGIFALAAAGLIAVASHRELAQRRWMRLTAEAGFVALPLLLLSSRADEAWARLYAIHVAAAALAIVIVLRTRSRGTRDSREIWWFGAGFLAIAMSVFAATVAAGTSMAWPIEMIGQSLRFVRVRPSTALVLPSWTFLLDGLALITALGYRHFVRNSAVGSFQIRIRRIGALSAFIGLAMAVSATGVTPLLSFAGFAWVALLPPAGTPVTQAQFAHLLLPPLAVMQVLHAFPVAGSQVSWSVLLLIPVAAVCIANGLRWLSISFGGWAVRRTPLTIASSVALLAIAGFFTMQLKYGLERVKVAYAESVPLGLPGSASVHVDRTDAKSYQAIVAAITSNCDSFLMSPGMNSFYIWTRQNPPFGDEAPELTAMLDDARQRRFIQATSSIPGLCLLENRQLSEWWLGGAESPPSLIDSYFRSGFEPISTFGDFRLLRRGGNG